MTLAEADIDRRIKVVEVGCRRGLKRRLGSMGLFGGVTAKVVSRSFGCAVVEAMNTRICVDESVMAEISAVYT